jgi:hypothetical protein
MAFSDDDIKINVTLDTNEAQIALKQFKTQFDDIFKRYKSTFKSISAASKEFSKLERQRIKTDGELDKKKLENEGRLNEAIQKQKTKRLEAFYNRKNVLAKISADADKRLLEDELKRFQEKERNKRAELKITADKAIQESKRQLVRTQVAGGIQIARIRASSRGGGIDPAASKSAAGGFDILTGSLGKTFGALARLQAQFTILKFTIEQTVGAVSKLAEAGYRLEGLEAGFATLQKSVGADPVESLNRLRQATQGLVSDVELYQKANQAVLLNIPTELFNDAAAAAVKLGRAMGIDAAFALESLSLGLGRQSRLYLDNLGIVVNATQAYQNYALSIGKTADQLTDAEKRLAFFAETQKRLREGLEGLPEVQDSVGVSFARLNASFVNVLSSFFKGVNNSESFSKGLAGLNTELQNLIPIFEKVGRGFGNLAGLILKARDATKEYILLLPGMKALQGLGGLALDAIAGPSIDEKRTLIVNLRNEIAALEKRYEGFTEIQKRVPFFGDDVQNRIEKLREQLVAFEEDVKKFDEERDREVKLRVDNQDLINQIAETESLFTGLKDKIETDIGVFKIPGVDDVTIQAGLGQLTEAFFKIETKAVGAEEGVRLVNEALNKLAEPARLANIATTIRQINELDAGSKDYKITLAELTDTLEKQTASLQLDATQRERIQKILQEARKRAKESVDQEKKDADERERIKKQELRDAQNFFRKLKAASQNAISEDFQRRLADIFNTKELGSDDLIEAIKEIRKQFIAAGGDAKVLQDEILALNQLKLEGATIEGDSGTTRANQQAKEDLKAIQEQMLNIREIFFGGKAGEGGGFFGFDLGEAFDATEEAQIAGSVQNALSTAFSLAVDGFTRDDLPELAEAIGSVIGTAIGAYFGGPAGGQAGAVVGGEIGKLVGEALKAFGDDLPGTKERKKVDKYFSELFDGDRLGTLIEGEVFVELRRRSKSRWGKIIGGTIDVLTGGLTLGAGTAIGEAIDRELSSVGNQAKVTLEPQLQQIGDLVFEGFTRFAGYVRFGSEEVSKGFNAFSSYFNTLPEEMRSAFTGVGLAFGELLNMPLEEALMLGTAFANNIGGNMQNLQMLVYQTGESFEDLSQVIIKAFLDSKLTIDQAYNSLRQLENIFQQGIPNAVGATQEAIDNVVVSLNSETPGLFAVDSLRDIGVEAQEASQTFESAIRQLGEGFGFSAEQIQLLFVAFQTAGVTSLEQLSTASDELTISLLERIRQIKENIVSTAEEVSNIGIIADIKPPTTSTGSSGPDPAKERADALKRLRDETYRLLIASQNYANILSKINNLELTNLKGGREIRKLREDIFKTLRRVNNLEEKYQEELNKGARASEKRLSRLGRALDEARKKLDELTEAADQTNDKSRQLDLAGIIPLIKSVNSLGVVTRQAGVDLEKNIDILLKGFLQGRLSISEVNAEIEKTRELLGPGIPNAVGAVTDAFQNLIDAGEEGGAFSVDAFTDIFAEFREKFEKEGSALREAQRQQLVANLEAAKQAFAQAVGPEATEEARKSLDLAKKALSDFYDEIPAPNLEDLRSALQAAFSPEQVDLFFRALDESGLKTFDDFEKAGADSVVGILGRLKELGFEFGETSQEIKDINSGLQDAEKSANGGLDPLAQAIELVKQFNEGASTLPPVFNSTTDALDGMNEPLQQLADGFDSIIEKLSLLSGQTFENDVVFNVRTVGDSNSQTLVDILFGDGSGVGDDVGGDGPGVGGDGSTQSKLAKFRRELAKLKSSGRGRSRRAQILRQRIRRLTGRGGNN